jgi:hypothetical protein
MQYVYGTCAILAVAILLAILWQIGQAITAQNLTNQLLTTIANTLHRTEDVHCDIQGELESQGKHHENMGDFLGNWYDDWRRSN